MKPVAGVPTIRNLLLGALAFAALAIYPGYSEPLKVAGLALVAALLVLRMPTPAGGPAVVLYVGLITAALSSALALEPAVALLGSVARAQGLLLAIALVQLSLAAASLSAQDRLALYARLAALGALISAYVLIQYLGLDPLNWVNAVDGRPAGSLSNATTLAGWLLLLVPITGLLLRLDPRRHWIGLALLLQLLALLATGSRSAWLALGVGVAALWWLHHRRRWRQGVVLLVVLLALTATLAALRPASLQDRWQLWQAAAHSVIAPPALVDLNGRADDQPAVRAWLGFGPDQQAPVLAAARTARADGRPQALAWEADRAHQWLLDQALELGWIGVLLNFALCALVLRALWAGWRGAPAAGRLEAAALALGLGAWALHLQSSFALTGDRALAWCLLGCALSLQPAQRAVRAIGAAYRAGLAALLLCGALAVVGLLPAALVDHLAPARQAERSYIAGQNYYAQGLIANQSAAMLQSAYAFEHAIALRRYDRDAAFAAASAWAELAAAHHDTRAQARAQHWLDRLQRMAPEDPRLLPIRARLQRIAPEA